MFNTLRRRLIANSVLPLLVVVPLIGLSLIYVLETQLLLPNITEDMTGEAALLAKMATALPAPWDTEDAHSFVGGAGQDVTARLMLLDPTGRLLASSDPKDSSRLEQQLDATGLAAMQAGRMASYTQNGRLPETEVADVLAPVLAPDGQLVGIVRLTRSLATVYGEFVHLRYLIAAMMGLGLLVGILVALLLALDLDRPLAQATQAVDYLARGQPLVPLPEQGLTETRRLLHAVNILVERLRAGEDARRQLLFMVIHELTRPLAALTSAVEALLSGAADDAVFRQELLVGMAAEIQHLRRLLDDLGHFREHVAGTLDLRPRSVELSTWLSQVLVTYRELAQRKGLRWQASIPARLPVVRIDPDRIGQAMGNLLSNAIKYTPEGGSVSVTAGVNGASVWIRVTDSGPGIPADEQSQVFMPFYRGAHAEGLPDSMGLGLAIARDLARAHGGGLELESQPGLGSSFTLRLPYSSAP